MHFTNRTLELGLSIVFSLAFEFMLLTIFSSQSSQMSGGNELKKDLYLFNAIFANFEKGWTYLHNVVQCKRKSRQLIKRDHHVRSAWNSTQWVETVVVKYMFLKELSAPDTSKVSQEASYLLPVAFPTHILSCQISNRFLIFTAWGKIASFHCQR